MVYRREAEDPRAKVRSMVNEAGIRHQRQQGAGVRGAERYVGQRRLTLAVLAVAMSVVALAACSSTTPQAQTPTQTQAKGGAQNEYVKYGCKTNSSGADCRVAGPFTDQTFEGSDFSYANFTGVDFSRSTFKDVNFTGTLLLGAKFSNARLDNVIFAEAALGSSNFTGAQCHNCWFQDMRGGLAANLNGAVLDKARFYGDLQFGGDAVFAETSLKGTKFEGGGWENVQFSDLKNVSDADFSGTDADVEWKLTLANKETPWEGMICPDGKTASDVTGEGYNVRVTC